MPNFSQHLCLAGLESVRFEKRVTFEKWISQIYTEEVFIILTKTFVWYCLELFSLNVVDFTVHGCSMSALPKVNTAIDVFSTTPFLVVILCLGYLFTI